MADFAKGLVIPFSAFGSTFGLGFSLTLRLGLCRTATDPLRSFLFTRALGDDRPPKKGLRLFQDGGVSTGKVRLYKHKKKITPPHTGLQAQSLHCPEKKTNTLNKHNTVNWNHYIWQLGCTHFFGFVVVFLKLLFRPGVKDL